MTSIWNGTDIIPVTANADNTYLSERFVGSDGVFDGTNTTFTLSLFAYQVDTGSLDVYLNGVFQGPAVDFTEDSNDSFSIVGELEDADVIVAKGLIGSTGAEQAAVSAAAAEAAAIDAEGSATTATAQAVIATTKASEAAVSAATVLAHLLYLTPEVRVSNTAIASTDAGKRIIASGTFTQTWDASVQVAGFSLVYKNDSTGEITTTTDGRTYKMYAGEERWFYWDTVNARISSIVLTGFYLRVTAAGVFVWTPPPGYNSYSGEMWNGGASGQKAGAATLALGGGGGGHAPFEFPAAVIGTADVNLTVGAGGAAVAGVANGNKGGVSSFGAFLVMEDHFSGSFSNGSSVNGLGTAFNITSLAASGFEAGATAVGINDGGKTATHGGAAATTGGTSTVSGSSVWGGAAGGTVTAALTVCTPGTSKLGGSGGVATVAGAGGVAGTAPGGGGGATQTGTASGAGAAGEIRFRGIP